MAKESPAKRKARRLKLELKNAYQMVEIALRQRDQARFIAGALEQEVKRLLEPKDSATIRVIEDEPIPVPDQLEEASAE